MGTNFVNKGPHKNNRRKEHTISKLLVRGSAKSPPIKNKVVKKIKKSEKNKKSQKRREKFGNIEKYYKPALPTKKETEIKQKTQN